MHSFLKLPTAITTSSKGFSLIGHNAFSPVGFLVLQSCQREWNEEKDRVIIVSKKLHLFRSLTIMNPFREECTAKQKTKSIDELMTKKGHSKRAGGRKGRAVHSSTMVLSAISSDIIFSKHDQVHFEKQREGKLPRGIKREASLVSHIIQSTDKFNDEFSFNKKRKTKHNAKQANCNANNLFFDAVEKQNATSTSSLSIDDDVIRPSSTNHSSRLPLFPLYSIKIQQIEEMAGTVNKVQKEGTGDEYSEKNKMSDFLVSKKGMLNVELNQGRTCIDHKNKNSSKLLAPCPPGDCEVMVGSIEMLASAIMLSKPDKQLNLLRGFIRRHQYGDETISGVKMEDGAVQFVLLNFPSGMYVNGFEDNKLPFWNSFKPNLIVDGLCIAHKIVCDSGWVACVHTFEQSNKVKEGAFAIGFDLWRSFTLVCDKPIYREVVEPKAKVHTLVISMFHRCGMPRPKPYYLQAGELDHHRCSLSRDLLYENVNVQEWLYKADGTPWRGGAQRSRYIWHFLLLAFSRYSDSVVDLIAGTGGFIKVASELGRHALGVEADEAIVHQLLESYI